MRFRFLMWIFSCSQTNNETSNFEIMSITYQYLDGVLCLEGKGNYELTDFDQVLDEGIKSAYRGTANRSQYFCKSIGILPRCSSGP